MAILEVQKQQAKTSVSQEARAARLAVHGAAESALAESPKIVGIGGPGGGVVGESPRVAIERWKAEQLFGIRRAEADAHQEIQAYRSPTSLEYTYEGLTSEEERLVREYGPEEVERRRRLTAQAEFEGEVGEWSRSRVEIRPGEWVDKSEWSKLTPSQQTEVRETGSYTEPGITISGEGYAVEEGTSPGVTIQYEDRPVIMGDTLGEEYKRLYGRFPTEEEYISFKLSKEGTSPLGFWGDVGMGFQRAWPFSYSALEQKADREQEIRREYWREFPGMRWDPGASAGSLLSETIFPPARALHPFVPVKEISGMEWGMGGLNVALLALPVWVPPIARVAKAAVHIPAALRVKLGTSPFGDLVTTMGSPATKAPRGRPKFKSDVVVYREGLTSLGELPPAGKVARTPGGVKLPSDVQIYGEGTFGSYRAVFIETRPLLTLEGSKFEFLLGTSQGKLGVVDLPGTNLGKLSKEWERALATHHTYGDTYPMRWKPVGLTSSLETQWQNLMKLEKAGYFEALPRGGAKAKITTVEPITGGGGGGASVTERSAIGTMTQAQASELGLIPVARSPLIPRMLPLTPGKGFKVFPMAVPSIRGRVQPRTVADLVTKPITQMAPMTIGDLVTKPVTQMAYSLKGSGVSLFPVPYDLPTPARVKPWTQMVPYPVVQGLTQPQTVTQLVPKTITELVTQTKAVTQFKVQTSALTETKVVTKTKPVTRGPRWPWLPPFPGGDSGKKEKRPSWPAGTITWRQGFVRKYIAPPYDDARPTSVYESTGSGVPKDTIKIIGGPAPITAEVDLGVVDVFVQGKSQRITFRSGGLKTDVGKRLPSKTKGMTVHRSAGFKKVRV